MLACLRNQPWYQQELCILVAWIGWNFSWNELSNEYYWSQYLTEDQYSPLSFLTYFQRLSGVSALYVFIKSYSVYKKKKRKAPKRVFFIFYLILHIKLLGGKSLVSLVSVGRINSSKLLYQESELGCYVRPAAFHPFFPLEF